MPAALPARTPLSESSTTRQRPGSTPKPDGRGPVDVRRRLAPGDFVRGHDRAHHVGDAERLHRRRDDPGVGRRGDRHRAGRGDAAYVGGCVVDHRCGSGGIQADDAVDDRRLDLCRGQVPQPEAIPHRLGPLERVSAHDGVLVVGGPGTAMRAREGDPDLVPPALAVDEDAVEVEDHRLESAAVVGRQPGSPGAGPGARTPRGYPRRRVVGRPGNASEVRRPSCAGRRARRCRGRALPRASTRSGRRSRRHRGPNR